MAIWYVREDTSHSATRNGTSYATAWGGWDEIVWGGASVKGGDTLYVCGPHAYSATKTVGAHGATVGNDCIIRGDAPDEAGSITFSTNKFLQAYRNNTRIVNLTITGGTSNCIYIAASVSNQLIEGCTFNVGTAACINHTSGATYVNLSYVGNTFNITSACNTSQGTAINFLGGTGSTTTFNGLSIRNNTFSGSATACRAVVHIRSQSDANAATRIDNVSIIGNTWSNFNGAACEIVNGFLSYGTSSGITISHNTVTNGVVSPSPYGGAFSIWGFAPGATRGNNFFRNTITNVQGAGGAFNLFYGSYVVFDNTVDGLSTTTIDGNGVLFDFGCQYSVAYSNTFRNLTGKSGVDNSGVGIMVLDSTNVRAFGNKCENVRVGIHLGAAGAGQSCVISNNLFESCAVYGVQGLTGADKSATVVKNNIFTAAVGTEPSVKVSGTAWTAEDYNCFYGFAAASGHTLGTNTITTDPQLDANGKPAMTSPAIGAGTHVGYVRGFDRVQVDKPPSMGAYERPQRTRYVAP